MIVTIETTKHDGYDKDSMIMGCVMVLIARTRLDLVGSWDERLGMRGSFESKAL